jgi:chromosome partitioning protein
VAALKGGTGKTSTAVGLAEALAADGQRIVLVDTDPQGSAMRWSSAAAEDGASGLAAVVVAMPTTDLARRLPAVSATADAVVLDTPPGHVPTVHAAAAAAEVIVVPMAPTLLDLDRVAATLDLARDVGRPAVVLLNRTRARTRALAGVREALNAAELPVLGVDVPQREAVANAWGLPVPAELRRLYQPVADELRSALADLDRPKASSYA